MQDSQRGGGHGTHPRSGRGPPRAWQFRGAARALPAARQSRGRAGPIVCTPLAETPRSKSRGSRGRERAGAARAGPLVAARARGGRARAPRVPGGWANGRPAFGKIAIYGHVLGPRASPPARAARSRLNSGGGGRGRSHTPPPAYTALLAASPSPPPPPPSPVSGPLASLPGPGPSDFLRPFLPARPACRTAAERRALGEWAWVCSPGWGQGGARRSAQPLCAAVEQGAAGSRRLRRP